MIRARSELFLKSFGETRMNERLGNAKRVKKYVIKFE